MERDGGLCRPGECGGEMPEQPARRGEKTLRETTGPRPLPPRSAGGSAEAMGAAFPQASGAGGWKKDAWSAPRGPRVPAPAARTRGATTPPSGPSRHCRRRPLPRIRTGSQGRGRGLRPLPSSPPCAAQLSPVRPSPPALTAPTAPGAPPLPSRLLTHPLPARAAATGSESRGARRVGTRGAFAPEPEAAVAPPPRCAEAVLGPGRCGPLYVPSASGCSQLGDPRPKGLTHTASAPPPTLSDFLSVFHVFDLYFFVWIVMPISLLVFLFSPPPL